MNHGLARLQELPVSVRLIREVHQVLLEGARGSHLTPGDPRRAQNWIGPAGCTVEKAAFVPPPPQETPRCLAELERFLHADTELPLLVKTGLAHAQFETIHPFLDGRGAANGHKVLESLYEAPIAAVNTIRELAGTTYQAANDADHAVNHMLWIAGG